MTITSPRPDLKNIGKYYKSNSYVSHTEKSKSLLDKIYFIARSIALNKKRKLLSQFSTNGKLLDYGCGAGAFLKFMKKNRWHCNGVEPSDKAREIAQKSGVEIAPDIGTLSINQFDIITLWHVLEHVHDLNNTLSSLKNLMKQNGTIIIAVPNYQSFDAQYYRENWAAYDVPRHLWHFTKESMTLLLKRHGLKLIDTKPMKMDSFYVSMLSEKYKGVSYPLSLLKGLLTGLKSNVKAASSKQYSSLIYIAQKE